MAWGRFAARSVLLGVYAFVMASPAFAHVKWFCGPVDITQPPLGLLSVLSPLTLSVGAIFLATLTVGALLDGVVVRMVPALTFVRPRTAWLEPLLLRLGVGAYCVCLWNRTAVAPWGVGSTILTPELFDSGMMLGIWQLGIAALLLSRRTVPLAALGLAGLYGLGIVRYGVFHMTDYVYFLGIVAYLLIEYGGRRMERWRSWRLPVLCLSMSFSLMWTAIEKLLYPQWTMTVLGEHPDLALGLPLALVTVIASFVESTLSFYLSAGQGLLRVGAAVLMLVFLSAVPEFGMLDTVGHIPIIAVFAVICLHGPSDWHLGWSPAHRGIVVNAGATAVRYMAAMVAMTALYYGLHVTTHVPLLAGTRTSQ